MFLEIEARAPRHRVDWWLVLGRVCLFLSSGITVTIVLLAWNLL